MADSLITSSPYSDYTFVATAGGGAVEVTASGEGVLTHVKLELLDERSVVRVEEWLTQASVKALDEVAATNRRHVLDELHVPEKLKKLLGSTDLGSVPEDDESSEEPSVVTHGQVTATVGADGRLKYVRLEQITGPDELAVDVLTAVNGALALSIHGPTPDDLTKAMDKRLADLDASMERLMGRFAGLDRKIGTLDKEQ